MELSEEKFQCPFCWQYQSLLVDPSEPVQEFIQDCEVCCRPIEFRVSTDMTGNILLTVVEE